MLKYTIINKMLNLISNKLNNYKRKQIEKSSLSINFNNK